MGLKLLNVPQIRSEIGYGTGLRGGAISVSIHGDPDRTKNEGRCGEGENSGRREIQGHAFYVIPAQRNAKTILLDLWFSTLDIH